MISFASFQEKVLDVLKAYTPLLILVPVSEMREESYQGTDFEYPSVRVDAQRQVPEGSGKCRPTISIVFFTVAGFSEDDSSLECEQICFEIGEALFGQQLEDAVPQQGPTWRTETVNLIQSNAPRRQNETWRGDVAFRCRVKET